MRHTLLRTHKQVQHLHLGLLCKTWIREHGARTHRGSQTRPKPNNSNRRKTGPPIRVSRSTALDICISSRLHQVVDSLLVSVSCQKQQRHGVNRRRYAVHAGSCVRGFLSPNSSTDVEFTLFQSRLHHNMHHRQLPPNGVRNMPGMGAPGVAGPGPSGGIPGHNVPPNASQQHPHGHGMPNGIGPSLQNPPQGQPSQQQQQNQAPPLGFPGHVQHQLNGVTPQSGPRGPIPGQPPAPGQHARTPGFYQSPTMAHPHTPTASGPSPYPVPGPGPNAIPPNGYPNPPQGMRGMPPPGAHPNGVANAASPGFVQGGSGSRAPTPSQNMAQGPPGSMTHPSPGMANRNAPQTPPNFGGPQGMGGPNGRGGPPFDQTLHEFSRIDPKTMNELRNELGIGNKEPAQMSMDERVTRSPPLAFIKLNTSFVDSNTDSTTATKYFGYGVV